MTGQKILGFILLILGLAIILYTLFISYNIFTTKSPAPDVFKIADQGNSSVDSGIKNQGLPAAIEGLLEEKLQEQLKAIMPTNAIPRLLNLISWSVLAGIFILGGGHIAGIGVNLIRK